MMAPDAHPGKTPETGLESRRDGSGRQEARKVDPNREKKMKDEAIKKAIDASVAEKTKELTGKLEYAADCLNSLLITLRHEMNVKHPHQAAQILQVLAQAAARHAALAMAHEAQLTALKCMQEAANAEYTEEE